MQEFLGVKPGDRLELRESPEGFILRPRRIDPSRLALLRGKLRRGVGTSISKHSVISHMPARYGIDTSILVRLLTGDPEAGFNSVVRALTALIDDQDQEREQRSREDYAKVRQEAAYHIVR